MARFRWIPFAIESGQSVQTTPSDLGIGIVVGISIHGTWTPAKIAFQAYVPNTGKTWAGPPFPYDNEWLDPNANYDFVRDDQGVTLTFGDGSATANQYLQWYAATKLQQGIYGFRYLKVASITGSGAAITQAQRVTGYLLIRDDY